MCVFFLFFWRFARTLRQHKFVYMRYDVNEQHVFSYSVAHQCIQRPCDVSVTSFDLSCAIFSCFSANIFVIFIYYIKSDDRMISHFFPTAKEVFSFSLRFLFPVFSSLFFVLWWKIHKNDRKQQKININI